MAISPSAGAYKIVYTAHFRQYSGQAATKVQEALQFLINFISVCHQFAPLYRILLKTIDFSERITIFDESFAYMLHFGSKRKELSSALYECSQ